MHHVDEIDQAISTWSKQFPSKEVENRLRTAGIVAERVRRINEVIDSSDAPTVFSRMVERRVGSMLTTTLPFSLSFVDLPTPKSAPGLGDHSVDVLRTWLNCTATEIEELQQQEVLQ